MANEEYIEVLNCDKSHIDKIVAILKLGISQGCVDKLCEDVESEQNGD